MIRIQRTKKLSRFASPKARSDSQKKRKKKKKKRRNFKESSLNFDLEDQQMPSTGNTVDDIINAVASGLHKRFPKRSKEPVPVLNIMPLPRLPAKEVSLLPPATAMDIEEQRSDSKRGRGRRRRNDDLYWYEGDSLDEKINPTASAKKIKAISKKPGRTTAKLKFTHNYDAVAPPLSPVKVIKTPTHPVPSFEDPDRLYCYCRCPYDEVSQMIGCDASDCPYEWFHFECVGISEAPEGTYYCPECRLRPKYRALFDEPFFQPQPPPQQII